MTKGQLVEELNRFDDDWQVTVPDSMYGFGLPVHDVVIAEEGILMIRIEEE
jgi:hypothetical protein